MGEPTVISTFAGAGGSSLGYEMAGYDERLAIDFNEHACETLRENFDTKVLEENIRELTGEDLLDEAGLNELDLLDGSPPCQGFSKSGNRQFGDDRNDLTFEFVHLVNEIQPKAFIMENVPAIAEGNMKSVFVDTVNQLREAGYNVRTKKLVASRYGTPQRRQRMFWVGVREDVDGEPVFPEPNDTEPTVASAIKDFNNPEDELEWARERPSPAAKRYIQKMKPGETASEYDPNGNYFNVRRLQWNRPSYTLLKMVTGVGMLVHPEEDRAITVQEAKRLCGFPDDFTLPGNNYEKNWARLGNSVMPPQMESVASAIKKEVFN